MVLDAGRTPTLTIRTSRRWLRRARASLKRPATVAHGAPTSVWPMESPLCHLRRRHGLNDQGRGQRLGVGNRLGRRRRRHFSRTTFAIPSWQKLKGVITKANEGSTKYRNGPDVSANSNFTFYVCADQTTCTANYWGGTSFAAPMWAGYLALANQQAAAQRR